MDAVIALYSPQTSPRFRWSAKVFFAVAMKAELVFYSDEEAFASAEGLKVNYSPAPIDGAVHISPHGLLWEQEISEQEFYTSRWEGLPIICQRQIGDLPFDPLSATFFLVSRYEEYLPFIADAHGRFPSTESFAYQNDFLNQPVVNLWALTLGKQWFGETFSLAQHYSYKTTVDIDNLFAYVGKGALRTLGAIGKDLSKFDFRGLNERLMVLLKLRRDPYNTFRKQRNINKNAGVEAMYFMLLSDFGPRDRNVSPYSTEAAVKLREIADWSIVGIHPSYASNSQLEAVSKERAMLQEIIRRPVLHSRQHYLRMLTPSTFRNMVEMGVKEEHSMGYADLPGFRASICSPYTFYDLELEAELPLAIHPFVFMDSTYAEYMNYDAAEAEAAMKAWVPMVKEVGGQFISTWHNRTFAEKEAHWAGWVNVYKNFIDAAKA